MSLWPSKIGNRKVYRDEPVSVIPDLIRNPEPGLRVGVLGDGVTPANRTNLLAMSVIALVMNKMWLSGHQSPPLLKGDLGGFSIG